MSDNVNLERTVLTFTSSIDILPVIFLKNTHSDINLLFFQQVKKGKEPCPARSHKSVWCGTSISKGTNKDTVYLVCICVLWIIRCFLLSAPILFTTTADNRESTI